jgi:hypothetical protein
MSGCTAEPFQETELVDVVMGSHTPRVRAGGFTGMTGVDLLERDVRKLVA